MKKGVLSIVGLVFICWTILSQNIGNIASESKGIPPYAKMKSVKVSDVKWTNGFWYEKFMMANESMLPNMWKILQDTGVSHAWENFRILAGLASGNFKGTTWYDGDVYKFFEACTEIYAVTGDKKLDKLLDDAIEVIGKAQAPDGYISTYIQIGKGLVTSGDGGESTYFPYKNVTRWQSIGNHELYNMGHLMTAACVHYNVTGKTSFLAIARKTGDYLCNTFKGRDPKLAHFCFNPSNIMGCEDLYQTTGDRKYLDLAKIFVDMRGSQPGGSDQNQDRTPLREETEAVGHAVTAAYLYAGATDVYSETGEKDLWEALDRIWKNVVFQKMYITGGTCAIHIGVTSSGDKSHEAFGREYELPNTSSYNETCANIANAMWNQKMFSTSGEARFENVVEKVIYNSGLSGINIDGTKFCYTNNLRWEGLQSKILKNDTYTRLPYLGCFCCPPNVLRTIAKIGSWAYSISDNSLWVNIYGSNILNTKLTDGNKIELEQQSNFPWDGKVKLVIKNSNSKEYTIKLFIPEWCEGAIIKVNGKLLNSSITADSYQTITRKWVINDIIELDLPMNVKLMVSNPLVEEVINQVAIMRGPVVYCLESNDLPENIAVSEIYIPLDIKFTPRFDAKLLGGVTVLEGEAYYIKNIDLHGKLYQELKEQEIKKQKIRLIPYFSWNNRGIAKMSVWMPLKR
jgi:uncharacterized protein